VTTQQQTSKLDGMAERSARWLRVSTNKKSNQQDEGQQVPDIERWESGHGYDVRKTYPIHGASAFKGNKTFDAMWAQVIEDILNGVFTVLVVWKINRLDRKLQAYEMIKEVVKAGGRVEFVMQPHLNDLSTMSGRVALNIESELAHGESKDKSDMAHRTIANHRANGAITSRPPFGYTVEGAKHNKRFIVVESLRAIVETIFKMCIAGDSLVTVAKWLDAEGVKTARGGKWSNTALKNIINNTAYMGYISDDNGRVIGQCPEIIDAATHKAANTALKSRPKRGPILAENSALCARVLLCPVCRNANHAPMYRIQGGGGPKGGGQAYYYRCAGRGAQRKGCGNMVRLDLVDAMLDKDMSINHERILKRVYVPGHNHDAEIADVDFRISQLSPEGLTRAEYNANLDKLWDEKEALQNLPHVDDDWKTVQIEDEHGNPVTYASKWTASDDAGKRAMLKETTIYAAKNECGEVYVIIEILDLTGKIIQRVVGNPAGPSLLERAKAKGLDKIVDADAAAEFN
jgi:DNA invertase Pin-like site-specific DNA recombinase